MNRDFEFPLFIHSAVAIVGFLLVLSLVSILFSKTAEPQRSLTHASSAAPIASVH